MYISRLQNAVLYVLSKSILRIEIRYFIGIDVE